MDEQQSFMQAQGVVLQSLQDCRRSLERIEDAVRACGPEQRPLVLAADANLLHIRLLLQTLAQRFNAATDRTTAGAVQEAIEAMGQAAVCLAELPD
jgi:hypothetical protein